MGKQTRFLVRRATKEVFIWTEDLAKRGDLEEVWAATAADALKRDTMPDPRRITLAEIDRMDKADLIIFAKTKLDLELPAEETKMELGMQVKQAIFSLPPEVSEEDAVKAAKEATEALAGGQLRSKPGM